MKKTIFNAIFTLVNFYLLFAFAYALPVEDPQPRQERGRNHQGLRRGQMEQQPAIPRGMILRDMRGNTWDEKSLDGKIVILDFWAPWCAPCLQQIPHLQDIHERYKGQGVLVLGVNVDNSDHRAKRRWLNRHSGRMGWPQLLNRNGLSGDLPRYFDINDIPDILVFDRRGRLVTRSVSSRIINRAVENLLKGDINPAPDQPGYRYP